MGKQKLSVLISVVLLLAMVAFIRGGLVAMAGPPLVPAGEFGSISSHSDEYGDYELALRVNEVRRGAAAQGQFDKLYEEDLPAPKLSKSQEYMLVCLTANLTSANLRDEDLLTISLDDFGFINGENGKEYRLSSNFRYGANSVFGLEPGGTTTFWALGVVDKEDESPTLYYRSLDKQKIYFALDKSQGEPDISLVDPIRDPGQKKGSWNNPYGMGDIAAVDFNRGFKEGKCLGTLSVTEAYRGKTAEEFIDPEHLLWVGPGNELLVLKITANVTETDGKNPPTFDSVSYAVLTGQGGLLEPLGLPADAFKNEGMMKERLGEIAEGYVAMRVPAGIKDFAVTYGFWTPVDNGAWIALEFSSQAPAILAAPDTPAAPAETEEFPADIKLTAVWNEAEGVEVTCKITEDKWGILRLDTRYRVKFGEGEAEDYAAAIKRLAGTIETLKSPGRELSLESDDRQLTITVTEKNDYRGDGSYETSFLLENAGLAMTDISGRKHVPDMKKLETALILNGFQVTYD